MQHLQHIAELDPLLAGQEIQHVIIAPGSRNAPLIHLFTRNRRFKCHSVVDERSAGYVALGMARHLGKPVVVVTTSGTAVLNLAPSVAEAFHQRVPIILFTADRPLESIRQFNNQVIDQVAPFYSHTKGFYEFPLEIRSDQEMDHSLSAVHQLLREAVTFPAGPIHVNIPMAEPLYDMLPDPLNNPVIPGVDQVAEVHISLPWKTIAEDKKILVLAGMGTHDESIRSVLVELASRGQLVVIAENIANLPSGRYIANPEIVLAGMSQEESAQLVPDLVVSFGGQVVSKGLKQFIQSLQGVELYEIEGEPHGSLKALLESMEQSTSAASHHSGSHDYQGVWKNQETRKLAQSVRFIKGAPFCNLSATEMILNALPGNSVVHLGNSGSVRYSQLMPVRDDLTYYSNRGTSGIDGCISSAVGAALVSKRIHTLLLGDLSFVYDSNALWNQRFPRNLKVVVLNDGGGGIFRLLDGPDRMEFFEEFSVTHHPVSLELLAQSFGRSFQRVAGREELMSVLTQLNQPGSSLSILEVDTTASENSRIFKDLFKSFR